MAELSSSGGVPLINDVSSLLMVRRNYNCYTDQVCIFTLIALAFVFYFHLLQLKIFHFLIFFSNWFCIFFVVY